MRAEIQYFKDNGKWYSTTEFDVPDNMPLYEIWNLIEQLINSGKPPGLIAGNKWEGYVLINVPDHEHAHPTLVVLNEQDDQGMLAREYDKLVRVLLKYPISVDDAVAILEIAGKFKQQGSATSSIVEKMKIAYRHYYGEDIKE